MRKNIVQRVAIDLGLFASMFISLVTGLVLWQVLPSGRRSSYLTFLGVAKHVWRDVHIYISLGFIVVLLLHLSLNFKLFSSMAKYLSSQKKQ
jgi:hypothetical protein